LVAEIRLAPVLHEWHIICLVLQVDQLVRQLNLVTDVFVEVKGASLDKNEFFGDIALGVEDVTRVQLPRLQQRQHFMLEVHRLVLEKWKFVQDAP